MVKGGNAAGLPVGFQIPQEVAVLNGAVIFRNQAAVAVSALDGTQCITLLNGAVVLDAQRGAPAVICSVRTINLNVGKSQIFDGSVVLENQCGGSVRSADRQAGDGAARAVQGPVQFRNGLEDPAES